ncbi:MAG TPA: hypothetical protein VMY42_19570, partial [Thermoguttaceae bacterium]|nr:hypothetical protein [Thermoguttaceae bacterium]
SWAFGPAGQALAAVADFSLRATVLAVLAVLGVHVVRIHEELRGRPVYVIREVRRGGVNAKRSRKKTVAVVGEEVTEEPEKEPVQMVAQSK